MTYENDIPEYALQPARAPKTIEAEAIYNTEKIVYPAEEQTVSYQFEDCRLYTSLSILDISRMSLIRPTSS